MVAEKLDSQTSATRASLTRCSRLFFICLRSVACSKLCLPTAAKPAALWCLLRSTLQARDAGRADRRCMEQWLPVVSEFGLDAGRQDSAVLFAHALCDALGQQQVAGRANFKRARVLCIVKRLCSYSSRSYSVSASRFTDQGLILKTCIRHTARWSPGRQEVLPAECLWGTCAARSTTLLPELGL